MKHEVYCVNISTDTQTRRVIIHSKSTLIFKIHDKFDFNRNHKIIAGVLRSVALLPSQDYILVMVMYWNRNVLMMLI